MTLAIRCENSAFHKSLRVNAKLAGKRVKCPVCGVAILVPRATNTAATAKEGARIKTGPNAKQTRLQSR